MPPSECEFVDPHYEGPEDMYGENEKTSLKDTCFMAITLVLVFVIVGSFEILKFFKKVFSKK